MRLESMSETFSDTTSETRNPAPYATLSAALYLMPGAASRKRATSSGLNTTGALRGSCMNDRCLRHLEEKPQRRDGGVDLRRACTARRQMQSKAAHVLRLGRAGRVAKKGGKVLDPLHVVMLGFRCELADRHVFDHAPTQRADGLLGHGDAPVLSEVAIPSISRQDAPIRQLMSCARGGTAAPYRASGLVP